MGKKDERRIVRGEVHRDGRVVKVAPCPFPRCDQLQEPGSPFKACRRHTALVADVLYIIDHAILPGQTKSAAELRRAAVKAKAPHIILPGEPAFNATVKEATSGKP